MSKKIFIFISLFATNSFVSGMDIYNQHFKPLSDYINSSNEMGATALHYAVMNGHYAVCEYLLKKGANSNRATNEGYTPLHIAAIFHGNRHRKDSLYQLLRKYNADPEAQNKEGKKPWQCNDNCEICFICGKRAIKNCVQFNQYVHDRMYHADCLQEWIKDKCPRCRASWQGEWQQEDGVCEHDGVKREDFQYGKGIEYHHPILTQIMKVDQEHKECNHELCTICQETAVEDRVKSNECTHVFHRNCLKHWLKGSKKTCPNCKTMIHGFAASPLGLNCLVDKHLTLLMKAARDGDLAEVKVLRGMAKIMILQCHKKPLTDENIVKFQNGTLWDK